MPSRILAKQVLNACRAHNLRLATVESCTGGLVAAALTAISGSSDVVECGFITYSNASKIRLVGVDQALLRQYGAVSEQVARAMAEGGLKASHADITVSITGIAGPKGGSLTQPVGLVHFAVAQKNTKTLHYEAHFGNHAREKIRESAVEKALTLILQKLNILPNKC